MGDEVTRIILTECGFEEFISSFKGGRIDHAHHFSNAYRALDETLAMETALLAAMEMVDTRDTLLVVTADHSNVMTLGGQATPRGHPVLGPDSKVSDVDGQPYTTILYGNGPGYSNPRPIPLNVTTVLEDKNAVHGSAVPRKWATHGGEDVPVYALGPLAAVLFSGTVDQSYIPHAIACAACFGPHIESCNNTALILAPRAVHTHCTEAEANNVPLVVASSVMIDDNVRTKAYYSMASKCLEKHRWSISLGLMKEIPKLEVILLENRNMNALLLNDFQLLVIFTENCINIAITLKTIKHLDKEIKEYVFQTFNKSGIHLNK